jgi:hypothetical protein
MAHIVYSKQQRDFGLTLTQKQNKKKVPRMFFKREVTLEDKEGKKTFRREFFPLGKFWNDTKWFSLIV